jgi:hypothetical protein
MERVLVTLRPCAFCGCRSFAAGPLQEPSENRWNGHILSRDAVPELMPFSCHNLSHCLRNTASFRLKLGKF